MRGAEERVQDFVDAAWQLIDERGTTEFTIQDVVARSGQSVRSFYQSFEGKDELLLALLEDSIHEQAGDLQAVVDQETEPLARLRAYTTRLYDWSQPGDTNDRLGSHEHRPDRRVRRPARQHGPDPRRSRDGAAARLLLDLLDDAVAAGVIQGCQHRAAWPALLEAARDVQLAPQPLHQGSRARVTADEIWDFCLHGFGA